MIYFILKKFLKINFYLCKKLELIFPNFFVNQEDYNRDLKKIIQSYVTSKSVKSILEIGGSIRPLLKKKAFLHMIVLIKIEKF